MTVVDDATLLRRDMVRGLVEERFLSASWRAAFEAVPRHLFLQRYFRLASDNMRYEAVTDGDPLWLEDIYRNTVLPTQLDGDDSIWARAHARGTPVQGIPTCSSTMPSLMAVMLEVLDVSGEVNTLEIGTGTGYNAAILCHRVGAERVATVDVDARLVERAEENLSAAGYLPTVATRDGTRGYVEKAPYDRIVATVSVPSVPPAWLSQGVPGGIIVTHLYRELGGDLLLRLRVGANGSAEGNFLPDRGNYMPVRSYPAADPLRDFTRTVGQTGETRAVVTTTAGGPDDSEFLALAAILLPGVAKLEFQPTGGDPQFWLFATGSWACHDAVAGTVEQYGGRRLWDELEEIHRRWLAFGSPKRTRLGLTVAPDGHHRLWLDSPTETIEYL